eukprot:m.130423 g.130423  ORF g.130423 m.130423 type:complete len:164 (+) comp16433_c0_seq4:93-584(+)
MADALSEAAKRKERLKAMRAAATGDEAAADSEPKRAKDDEPAAVEEPVLKFRNYKPTSLSEEEYVTVAPAEVPDVAKIAQERIESDVLESVVNKANPLDVDNLAPRKIDWDLKRDCAKKLQRLEKRTQRAIAEMIRERLQKSDERLDTVDDQSAANAGGSDSE